MYIASSYQLVAISCTPKIAYFMRKTTYSNRKFDIIDGNKWLIFYMPFYILNIRYYIINRSFLSYLLNINLQTPYKTFFF